MPKQIKQTDFTPPQIAAMLGANVETVMHFVRNGELVAYNLGTAKRARWRISQIALDDFRNRRSTSNRPVKKTIVVRKLV